MHRGSKTINAPLEAQENESRYTEEKEEASQPHLPKKLKICKVTKSKVLKASKKENLSEGNEVQLPKSTLKYTRGLEKQSHHSKEDVASCQFTECFFGMLKGDVVDEHPLPLSSKENVSRSRSVSLGDECYLSPKRDKAEEESDWGGSEKQRRRPLDLATVTIAEFGIIQESVAKQSIGKSPTSLKLRRRSAIGVRGSPDNDTLIRFLAQQRSNRQKAPCSQQVSPFQHVRSLKEKIDAFQTSFKSVQEAEGESGPSVLSQVDDASQEGSCFSSDCLTKDIGSNVLSDLSRKKIICVEEVSLEIFDKSKTPLRAPVTPPQRAESLFHEGGQSAFHLRPVLRKTPVKQLLDSIKECSNDAGVRGEDESLAVSSCAAETLEALQTEKTAKAKKKRVTFGEDLSPEIFDQSLPANTPLRRGATPGCQAAAQSHSPSARARLPQEPLAQPNFDSEDECEPPEKLVEGPVAAEDFSPVENAEAETDRADVRKTPPSTRRKQCSSTSEGTHISSSSATDTKNAEDTKNPRKNKLPRQKNPTTSAAKRTQKKHTSYGKRRKKKAKKSLYGEREMASKKPLLSPIPEIPEVFSSASPPSSPKANALLPDHSQTGNAHKNVQQKLVVEKLRRRGMYAVARYASSADLGTAEGSSSSQIPVPLVSDLESLPGIDHDEVSNIVPDAECGLDTFDYFQQGEETVWGKEGEGNDSLVENKKLQRNLNQAELEFLEQQDTNIHEGAQRTQCPQKDSLRASPRRRRRSSRRSSGICIPPVENLELTGNNLLVSSFNVEEILSAPQLKNDSLEEPFRRKSARRGEKRVRRSMRLQKDAEGEGLAWVQVPSEKPPLLAPAPRVRRTINTPFLLESENIHHRQQNLTQFPAPGKENKDSARAADGPSKRWRRKSICVSTPQETRTWAEPRRRSMTNAVCRKDRSNQKHYEGVEIPLETNI